MNATEQETLHWLGDTPCLLLIVSPTFVSKEWLKEALEIAVTGYAMCDGAERVPPLALIRCSQDASAEGDSKNPEIPLRMSCICYLQISEANRYMIS